jgi:putative ABC transport system permease protein
MSGFQLKLPNGVRRLFRLPQSYRRRMRDLDEEIRFHIEAHVAKLIATGVSEEDAHAAALARFGDVDDLRSYCGAIAARREPGRWLREWADEFVQNIEYGSRQIVRAPKFTATVAVILALGIGANTGIFSIVHRLLIAPLPFADGNRMVQMMATERGGRLLVDPPVALRQSWQTRAKTVEQHMSARRLRFTLGDSSRGATETLNGAAVSPAATRFLGERPLIGRMIGAADTVANASPVAVIGEALWRRSFGGTSDVLGQRVLLNGVHHTIIGVVSERFVVPFLGVRDLLVPFQRTDIDDATVLAKLRPGVTIEDANREIARMFPPTSELNPFDDPPKLVRQVDMTPDGQKHVLLALLGAVGIIVLIGCANVANLLLARAWNRQREFAVRAALGAGRGRIIRQVLTESVSLALIAGVLGLVVAHGVVKGVGLLIPGAVTDVRIDAAVFAWSAAVSLLAGILFGIAPAFTAADGSVAESLKAGARVAVGSRWARRLRVGLVVSEMALSVVLLVGAGLLVRTLFALSQADLGFQPRGIASVELRLDTTRFRDATARRSAALATLDAVKAIPGVLGATLASASPPSFSIGAFGVSVDGHTSAGDTLKTLGVNGVAPDYFAFAGINIKQGRTFSAVPATDNAFDSGEIIINETLARRLWPDGGALGARLRRNEKLWGTVVGIVSDVRLPSDDSFTRLNKNLQLYFPQATGAARTTLLVRSNLPTAALGSAVTTAVRGVSSAIRVAPLRTADEVISASTRAQKIILQLIGSFALLAIVLAAFGLHAVIAYSAHQRTREIGVRVALGAQNADVMRLILRQGLALAVAGTVIGVIAAVGATRILRSYLYGVTSGDPVTLGSVALLLIVIATLATYAPARRAARLDPLEALRAD